MQPILLGRQEVFQEQRGVDGPGQRALAGVDDVADRAFDAGVVRRPQRHMPERVVQFQAQVHQVAGDVHVLGEQGRQLPAQGDAGGAGQCRQVDDQVGLALGRVSQRVTQDDAALGVGIADLDVQALAGLDDITRPEGIARDRVLHRGNQELQPHRQLEGHDQAGQAQRIGGAAHVLLHLAHAVAALDIQAATVEADPLADQGQPRVLGIAPLELDQPR
mmetsp:Transcript_23227/g.55015  ORF Transcript_23227/g.55015 Transcript_23227/m.55015 type:complete len:219 (-) Transcript_23227:253-909(-)